MTFFDYILILAMAQGFILAFFLLTSRYYRSKANQCLAIALIILSTQSILDILGQFYQTTNPIAEFFINDLSYDFLVYVPLYFFFLLSSLKSKLILKDYYYLCLPFVIDSLANLIIVGTNNLNDIINSPAIQLFYDVEGIASLLFNLLLCYKSYRLITNHVDHDGTKNHLIRIWNSTLALLVLWIIVTIVSIINEDLLIFITLFYSAIALWLFWMIYNGVVNLNLIEDRNSIKKHLQENGLSLNQERPLTTVDKSQHSNNSEIPQPVTNSAPSASLQKLSEHFEDIKATVQDEKLYRNEDLSIDDVAKRFGLSAGYISQIVKKGADKNFPAWINAYRIADAKTMLSDPSFDNYTILAIGLEAGFKSKSAFYAIFKKTTGLTPAQFRQKES